MIQAYDKDGTLLEPGMLVRYERDEYTVQGTFDHLKIGAPMILSYIILKVNGEDYRVWIGNRKYLKVIVADESGNSNE